MLVDANILLYAVDESSPFHAPALGWLETALNGEQRVGIPWASLTAFMRIATHPRAAADPLPPTTAWHLVETWLDAPATWVPLPGPRHRDILGDLIERYDLRANLIADAVLVALCIENGLSMISADTDFARFKEVTWTNPTAP